MLIENGVSDKRLSAVGLASRNPLLPNTTPDNRAKNRRVTITILSPEAERMNTDGSAAGN
jgi:chemotaxis protein MotB